MGLSLALGLAGVGTTSTALCAPGRTTVISPPAVAVNTAAAQISCSVRASAIVSTLQVEGPVLARRPFTLKLVVVNEGGEGFDACTAQLDIPAGIVSRTPLSAPMPPLHGFATASHRWKLQPQTPGVFVAHADFTASGDDGSFVKSTASTLIWVR